MPEPLTTADRRQLVLDYLPLVFRQYQRLRARGWMGRMGPDEAASWGAEGLVRAANTFDPARGDFLGYAAEQIEWKLLTGARQQLRRLPVPVSQLPPPAPGHQDALGQLVVYDPPIDEPLPALRRLPARQRELVRRVFWDNDTLTQVAADWGVSASRLSQLLARALAKLRSALEGSEQV